VSRSSAEAKYCAMAITTCELKWLKGILSSLNVIHTTPMLLHYDSQVDLHISQNLVFHDRAKHIEVDCHFIRDVIILEDISPSFVPTNEQLADIFIKALRKQEYSFLFCKLDIRDLHPPT